MKRAAIVFALAIAAACTSERVATNVGEGFNGEPGAPQHQLNIAMPMIEGGVATAVPAAYAPDIDGAVPAFIPAAIPMPDQPGQMLVRTGRVELRVDTLERAMQRVREVAEAVGAILTSSSTLSGDTRHRSAAVALKVSPEHFDRAIEGLRRVGTVEALEVAAQDVGEEYVDVGARIANGRRLEARLLRLLDTRAGRLADVIAVERELARVRQEVDRLEGRLRYLVTRAALSDLTVNLHEPATVVGIAGSGVMRMAAEQSWENFVWVLALLVRSVGVVVPLGVLAAAFWMALRRLRSGDEAKTAFISLQRPELASPSP